MKITNLCRPIPFRYIRIFILLIACCFLPGITFSQSYPYKFNYLTVDEGLSHTDANDIIQDKHGYIWVATYFGINRYDGHEIKKYYNDNEPINNAFKNRVRCLYADDEDKIWLGTEAGLQCFNPKTESYSDFPDLKKYTTPPFSKLIKPAGNLLYGLTGNLIKLYLITENTVVEQSISQPAGLEFSDIAADKNGTLYLSSNKGVYTLDKNKKFRYVPIEGLPSLYLSRLYFNKQNNLLVANETNIFLTATKPGVNQSATAENLLVSERFTGLADIHIKDILQSIKGDYWLNIGSGLVRLNQKLNLIQIIDNKSSQHSLNSKSISRAFIDRSQCLWAGTFGGGVNYCDLNQKLFYTLQHDPQNPNSLSGNHIRSVLAEGNNVWIGTTANGLNRYNLQSKSFTFYNSTSTSVRLKNDEVSALTFDNNHNLWIGTGAGIQILKSGENELLRPPGYEQFPNYTVETLVKDCYGNIWFGNHMNNFGVIWKDKQNNYRVKYYDEGYFILADERKPQLFISSTGGLKRLIIDREGNVSKTFHYKASAKANSLSSDYTYPICKQNDSTYWIGTIGGGLNRLLLGKNDQAYKIESFTDKYGIFNDVESMEIDHSGNIWMGGNGLENLNLRAGKLIRYDKNDGLQGNSFKVGSSFKGTDGRLYFGGINGLNYFYPDQIKSSAITALPVFTNILINNQAPEYDNSDSKNYIEEAITYSKKLTLNYLQNNFVISFSSMDFANPLKCKYRYKLIGFDKEWRFTDGENPTAAYSNLDYNAYKFILQATNIDGIWSKNQAEIAIEITPPWWKSTVAKTVYWLLVLTALSGIYIYQARWYRLKREIAISAVNERKREEMHQQRAELYQQQLQFFTNISHEFRTPLTLILGPLENLMSQNTNMALSNSYQLMLRNTKRLMNLISELMNFKKAADSIIKLKVQPVLLHQFCKDLAFEFQNLAVGKDMNFRMTDHTEKEADAFLTGPFDVRILEKILLNLLNNAFKYTNPGGDISFEIFTDLHQFNPSFETEFQLLNKNHRAGKYIYFRVADSGIGISSESITKIFDRYYRISKDHLGSGVGLALVKSLTELHKGDIYVYSERHKGTEIIIGIPLGEENYTESEKTVSGTDLEPQLEVIDNSVLIPLAIDDNDKHPENLKSQKRILLVDDNYELRSFFKQTFDKHYHIYEAADGNEGLEIAAEKVPDLIISDVMMPVMNGIEFCKLVKERFETSHIPFIILSAKDALDSKIEGMESGADFYFGKPLSMDLLLLTVHNIFEQAEKLKHRYTNDYLAEATELVHTEKDKEFLQKLLNLIEENIEDPDLDVDFLCTHLYISRTKLYQKIKSISDQSVGEFIRTIRLKKAIQIMTHEDITMNEVVDRIGLQSSSNFSRAFKKEYGKSPVQFMQALKKG